MHDLISRQAAIDTLNVGEELLRRVLDEMEVVGNEREKFAWGLGLIEAYIADIKDLPPAQPDLQPTCNQLATNTISRQAAIDVMFAALNDDWELDYAKDRMCELPSAQPVTPCYLGSPCEYQNPDAKMPSVQPEVIRCKDCKNWDTTWQNDWAKNYHYCPLIDGTRNGDWYCADAERRST